MGSWPTAANLPVTTTPSFVATGAVGTVTSGNFSPVLERGIALALIDTGGDAADVVDGDELVLDVRGRHLPARVTALPFVPAGSRRGSVGGGN